MIDVFTLSAYGLFPDERTFFFVRSPPHDSIRNCPRRSNGSFFLRRFDVFFFTHARLFFSSCLFLGYSNGESRAFFSPFQGIAHLCRLWRFFFEVFWPSFLSSLTFAESFCTVQYKRVWPQPGFPSFLPLFPLLSFFLGGLRVSWLTTKVFSLFLE